MALLWEAGNLVEAGRRPAAF